jgi:chromosome segregation ATPase
MDVGAIGSGSSSSTGDQATIRALRLKESQVQAKIEDVLAEKNSTEKQQELQLLAAQIVMLENQIQELERKQSEAQQAKARRQDEAMDQGQARRPGGIDLLA